MNTSLDSIIKRLQEIREEVGGEAPVRDLDTPSVYPEYRHPLDHIAIGTKVIHSGAEVRTVKEVVFIPYKP